MLAGKSVEILENTIFFEDHLISDRKTVDILEKTFFFFFLLFSDRKTVEISGKTFFFFFLEITSFFEPNYSIFSVYFGLYKTTLPSHLSCPRAHVWLSAPLNEIKGLQNLKLFDCMRSNTFCTPSTACNQNFSKVGD